MYEWKFLSTAMIRLQEMFSPVPAGAQVSQNRGYTLLFALPPATEAAAVSHIGERHSVPSSPNGAHSLDQPT